MLNVFVLQVLPSHKLLPRPQIPATNLVVEHIIVADSNEGPCWPKYKTDVDQQ